MSAMNENYRHDNETVDGEHKMQIELIEAVQASLRSPLQYPRAVALMEQLQSFCSAHFMSEELLMRLCSYPDYDDHAADHERTMDTLTSIAPSMTGDAAVASEKLGEIKGFLCAHIRSRDAAFTDYYRRWSSTGEGEQLTA